VRPEGLGKLIKIIHLIYNIGIIIIIIIIISSSRVVVVVPSLNGLIPSS
jgi:hypothetical protein